MGEAVILANGKAIKKSFFDTAPLSFNHNGFVKGFTKNGVSYIALYAGGKIDEFTSYYVKKEYYKVVADYNNKGIKRPKGILNPHKYSESNFTDYAVINEDTIILQTREATTSGLCLFLKSFTHNKESYDITTLISDPDEQIVTQDCTPLTPEAESLYQSAAARDSSYPEWDMGVIADIAEIMASMEDDVKGILQDNGSLPVYGRNIQGWTSEDDAMGYIFYTNDSLKAYRDYLKKYKAWFLAVKEKMDTLEPDDNTRLYSVIGHMSARALEELSVDQKIAMLDIFCTDSILGYYLSTGEFNEEHITLKVIRSIKATEAFEFLTKLAQPGRYSSAENDNQTIFELLYNKIGDEFIFGLDDPNRHSLMTRLYLLWYVSDYNPYVAFDDFNNDASDTDTLYDALRDRIVMLAYESNKEWGFYVDNMNFNFIDGKIEVEPDSANWLSSPIIAFLEQYIDGNKYSYYQAISFQNKEENDYAVKIPGIAIVDRLPGETSDTNSESVNLPLFFLKYMDDYGDNEDLWTGIGLAVDVILTFTGIGNLAKLRHLRHVTKLGRLAIGKAVPAAEKILATQALRGIVGAVELTSSIASLILNYYSNGCQIYIDSVNQNFDESNADVEIPEQSDNPDFEWCRNLDRWLMAVQLLSAGVDTVSQFIVRRSSKRLIDAGLPNSFPDDALTIVASYADDGDVFLTAFRQQRKQKITNNLNNSMWRANLDKAGNVKNPKDFELIYDSDQVEELIRHATNNNLSTVEIEAFIFIGGRRGKNIPFDELKTQMNNWKNIKNNIKYPYKFNSLSEFNTFKTKIRQQLAHWDIPIEDVRVQGSSLRTPNAKDVDIAVMISESQIANVRSKIIERYRKAFTKSNGKLIEDKFEKAVKKLDDQISKGYIKNRQFGLLDGQEESFMKELYDIRNTYQGSLDLSIIIKERNFNTPPYLNF